MPDGCVAVMLGACPTHARRICTDGRTDGRTYGDCPTSKINFSLTERARAAVRK